MGCGIMEIMSYFKVLSNLTHSFKNALHCVDDVCFYVYLKKFFNLLVYFLC